MYPHEGLDADTGVRNEQLKTKHLGTLLFQPTILCDLLGKFQVRTAVYHSWCADRSKSDTF